MTVAPHIDQTLAVAYPGLRFGYLLLDGVHIGSVPPRFKKQARALEAELRDGAGCAATVAANMEAWQGFVVSTGDSENKPAPAWLHGRILRGGQIPKLLNVIDAANLVALSTGLPVGAFDLGAMTGNPRLSLAQQGETMIPLFEIDAAELVPGEVVYRDDLGVFSRYAKDSDRTKITENTTSVLCVVDAHPGVADAYLDAAVDLLVSCLADVLEPGFSVERAIARVEAR